MLSLTLCCLCMPISTYAVDEPASVYSEQAVGLISDCDLSISAGSDLIYVTMTTNSESTMSKIGFTNIKIERSSNRANWTTETNVSDKVLSNSNQHYFEDFPLAVHGGYYYRITLTHYAKDYSGNIQTESNTSNSVWVS